MPGEGAGEGAGEGGGEGGGAGVSGGEGAGESEGARMPIAPLGRALGGISPKEEGRRLRIARQP